MTKPDELKPCPFCPTGKGTLTKWMSGSVLDEFAPYSPTCDTCGCELGDFDTEQQARDAWNTRSTPDLSRILKLAALYCFRERGIEMPLIGDARIEVVQEYLKIHHKMNATYKALTTEDIQLLEAVLKE